MLFDHSFEKNCLNLVIKVFFCSLWEDRHFSHFIQLVSFETPWNFWFFDVFRKYWKRAVAWNGLIILLYQNKFLVKAQMDVPSSTKRYFEKVIVIKMKIPVQNIRKIKGLLKKKQVPRSLAGSSNAKFYILWSTPKEVLEKLEGKAHANFFT